MTAEELLALPDSPYRHELIKGELLTMPLPGGKHGVVTMKLAAPLHVYVDANNLGVVLAAETGFLLERNPDTVLGPDIAFIRRERFSSVPDKHFELAPDLVVEVSSPSQSRPKTERKASRWLEYGVLEVWLIDSNRRTVDVRRAAGNNQLLREGEDLTGGDIVPGFKIPLSEIFG
jgi:Uma2 family endonuclease